MVSGPPPRPWARLARLGAPSSDPFLTETQPETADDADKRRGDAKPRDPPTSRFRISIFGEIENAPPVQIFTDLRADRPRQDAKFRRTFLAENPAKQPSSL